MHPTLVGPIMATHLKIKESPLVRDGPLKWPHRRMGVLNPNLRGHTKASENFARCANVLSWFTTALLLSVMVGPGGGHEATETGLAYAPVSQAHGHNHIVQCFACCTAA